MMWITETETYSSEPEQQVHIWNRTLKKGQRLISSIQAFSRPKSFSRHHRCKVHWKNIILPGPLPLKKHAQSLNILNAAWGSKMFLLGTVMFTPSVWHCLVGHHLKLNLIFNISYDPFFCALDKRNNLWGVWRWSYGPSSLTQRLSVLILREVSADRCGWVWLRSIPGIFSIVYYWNWSWRYCSFPHKRVGAL